MYSRLSNARWAADFAMTMAVYCAGTPGFSQKLKLDGKKFGMLGLGTLHLALSLDHVSS
jgi:hypothetical protein